MIKIKRADCNFEREPLVAPFGFKGGYVNEIWQAAARLESESGESGVGLAIQSILWSDAAVFAANLPTAGNALMYLITAFALQKSKEIPFETPTDLLEKLYPLTLEYGKKVTGNPNLRPTFALNALVAVDNAAWLLYAREKGISNFDDLIPDDVKPALLTRHEKLSAIPLITYGIPMPDVVKTLDEGCFFLKVKIGSDPEKDGDLNKMVEWDKKRLSDIHEAAKDRTTPYTADGKIPYYLDANGRYDNKDRLLRLLDHADKIGALERIMLLEEPFPEEYLADVSDIPVRLAADESAHSDADAKDRIDLGYKAIALKPIAKTLSMSFKILKIAHERKIPCFCADLTVSPVMVDWNKNVASRLAPLPGMNIGVLETNGHQNYTRWETLKSFHPCAGAPWTEVKDGTFTLNKDFYDRSGGIFLRSEHYENLVK